MGVLEFFGTLIKNDITATSIKSNFSAKMNVNHLLLDFNSIIHVSSMKILSDINTFLQIVLRTLYAGRSIMHSSLTEQFEKYNMTDIQIDIDNKINSNKNSNKINNTNIDIDPRDVIMMFWDHFDDQNLDKLIITNVINTVLQIIRTFCQNKNIETLMLAIDGVPSKGKLVEQKQRRYLGAIVEQYKKKILAKYKKYLLNQPDYAYLAVRGNVKWSRNKITPGTAFMHKLVTYLRSEKIQAKFKVNRPNMKIILSDMYEVGEGEKKIVNYVNKYLANTSQTVMIYSPDADVILLCMLLPVTKLYMLRHNQQTSAHSGTNIYDLIDIKMLKKNISYYINNHPDLLALKTKSFEIDRINYDIVCLSTLFGNDFVPKMETLNVKKGFQNIMDAYLRSLIKYSDKGYYLVKYNNNNNNNTKNNNNNTKNNNNNTKNNAPNKFTLNFTFLKDIIRELIPEENDFIKHNKLYSQYIYLGQIKNVFDHMEINAENLVSTVRSFNQEYDALKNLIRNNGDFSYFENSIQFMSALKKSVNVKIDEQAVNTSYLTNEEMIKVLKDYFSKYRDFPRLNINLHTWSHSITDHKHQLQIKAKKYNDYQKELYKFDNLLDEYYIKFNHQPLDLTSNKIPDYYEEYFGVRLYEKTKNGPTKMTNDALQVMHKYIEGLLWVFNYYFNDTTYINKWYYLYERAPLLKHISVYLETISREDFNQIYDNLNKYMVSDLSTYFNPVEQLAYVSPMTNDIIKLLPSNYREYIESDDLDPFLRNYFVDVNEITDKLWDEKVSNQVDCKGIAFFNKCSIKFITKPSAVDDKLFLKAIRNVRPSEISKKRSQSSEPDY